MQRFRSGLVMAILLFLAALAARLPLMPAVVAGDEAAHYYVARTLGQDPPNVEPLYPHDDFLAHDYIDDPSPLFWQRPLFSLILAPAAQGSLETYRFVHVVLASLVPVVAYGLLRSHRVPLVLSFGAGLVVALHPNFVLISALVFPDTLLALFVGLALWADAEGRPGWAAASLVAAMWCKETAFLAVLVLLAFALARGRSSGEASLWPPRLNRAATGYLLAWSVAWLPLLYSLKLGGIFPGWGHAGKVSIVLERLPIAPWLLPLLLVGLAWSRTRPLSALALGYFVFHLSYLVMLGGEVAAWHYPLPNLLSVAAAGLVLDELAQRVAARARPAVHGVRAVGVALALAVLLVVTVPATAASKRLAYPLSGEPEHSLFEIWDHGAWEDRDLADAVAATPAGRPLFLVDVMWFHALYPFGGRASSLVYVYTWIVPASPDDALVYGRAAEAPGVVTVLAKHANPLNEALRVVYADCALLERPSMVVLDTGACAGRGEALRHAYASRLTGA